MYVHIYRRPVLAEGYKKKKSQKLLTPSNLYPSLWTKQTQSQYYVSPLPRAASSSSFPFYKSEAVNMLW